MLSTLTDVMLDKRKLHRHFPLPVSAKFSISHDFATREIELYIEITIQRLNAVNVLSTKRNSNTWPTATNFLPYLNAIALAVLQLHLILIALLTFKIDCGGSFNDTRPFTDTITQKLSSGGNAECFDCQHYPFLIKNSNAKKNF